MSISNYNDSPIYNISIRYNGELVKFNLAKELKYTHENINSAIRNQPTKYGFCLLIHKGLLTRLENLKDQRVRTFARLFFKAKGKKVNNRPLSDDLCKRWVEKHNAYKLINRKCIQARDDADKIFSCIKAFEQRSNLMQTLSSNTRSEKIS